MKLFIKIFVLAQLNSLISCTNSSSSSSSSYFGRKLKSVDWCSIKCRGHVHVACNKKCSSPAKPCELLTLYQPDIDMLIDSHNKYRNLFASGKDPVTLGLEIANMKSLRWDDELAYVASCNLVSCPKGLNHDKCRITPTWPLVGQNLAWSAGRTTKCNTDSARSVKSWYDEIKLLTMDIIGNYSESYGSQISGTGHFTQVVWADTLFVGCAITSKINGRSTECMLACNYAPAGNVIGTSMFKKGSAASDCPAEWHTSTKFPALCEGATFPASNIILLISLVVCKNFIL